MDEQQNAQWNQMFGTGAGAGMGGGTDQLQFLYDLASRNPGNQDYANQYLNSYMNYTQPQYGQGSELMYPGQQTDPGAELGTIGADGGMEVSDAELYKMKEAEMMEMWNQGGPQQQGPGEKLMQGLYKAPGVRTFGGIGSYLTGGSSGYGDYMRETAL